jgi:hypothetical protein
MNGANTLPAKGSVDSDTQYKALREEGIDVIQALGVSQWTDNNNTDPGITFLEQICYQYRDNSMKQDITPLRASLAKNVALKQCNFRWQDSDNAPASLGFIAQEVEAVPPDCMHKMGEQKSIINNDFSVLTISRIQEQRTKNNALGREVDALKAAS